MPCMKTSDRLATILFLLAAPAARLLELKNNYDPAGLPPGGFPNLPAVLAGEMAGDWPLEALKAQAILARTFVLQFVSQKESMYDGADISTDIKEAQAYDAAGVNARIREAVKETRGEVRNAGGELPYAWVHAHSGGLTARAKEGLDYEKAEPSYTQCV